MPDPEEKAYSDEDVEAARIIADLRSAGIPDEGLLEITRVLGRSLAQGAEVIRSVSASAFLESGITEYELARRNAEAASQFLPRMAPLLQSILRLHLRDLVRNQVRSQEELAAGAARVATMCTSASRTSSGSRGWASGSSWASWAALGAA